MKIVIIAAARQGKFVTYFVFSISRAMAVSISLMFGRLGSVAGSNLTAVLLDASCENAFYLPGCSLISK